jgi:hypothetical protein
MTGPSWTKRSGALLRVLAATGLAVAMLASVSANRARGQQTGLVTDTTYVFALDGMVVEWGGNWAFDPDSSGQDAGVEVASLLSPLAGLLIGELAGGTPLDLDQFLALVLDSIAEDADEFVTVERSATEIVSYSLDAAVIDGIPAGLFTYIQPNSVTGAIIFTSILAEATTFASSVADAQANVTVNGRIALEGIDGAALQNLLPEIAAGPADDDRENDNRQGSVDEDQQTSGDGNERADDEPDQAGGEEDGADQPAFDNDDEQSQDDGENRGRSHIAGHEISASGGSDDDGADELAALGLVEDGLYESPQFGTEIEWSTDWVPNPELLSSNEDDEVDNLGLNNDGGALVLVTVFAAGEATPEDFAAYWQSDDFLDENASPEAEILLADSTRNESAVLTADVLEGGGEFWSLRQAYSLDGGDTIAIVLMLSVADDFPDNLEEAQDGIAIDGDPALSFFSIDEIEDAA